MKISKFKDKVRALRAIAKYHTNAALGDVQFYVGERLLFASYERGRTQILKLTAVERRELGQLLLTDA